MISISRELAADRAARLSAVRYDVSLEIPNALAAPIPGQVRLAFTLAGSPAPLLLDFDQPPDRLRGLRINGTVAHTAVDEGHVVLPPRFLTEGPNVVELDFVAGDAPLNRREDFLYSLFVPARASAAMPVFDQPDIKARWTLGLTLPFEWVAVGNCRETSVSGPNHQVVSFSESPPLPTYLFAFAAGRLSVETLAGGGRPVRVFHREKDQARVRANLDAIYDLHISALSWMETYTGIPYPFEKFDIVVVPAFQFSGMEHPGVVLYNADALLLDGNATRQQALKRAELIAHETAHMWFGNLVTMPWFDEVWIKEVFAGLMADKIVAPQFPEVDHELRLLQHHVAAYEVDRTAGTTPVRQPLDDLADAGSVYNAIVYHKAPIVMRQVERWLGERSFRDGVRSYLSAHAYGNAAWPDLLRHLNESALVPVADWTRPWLDESGRPTIRTELEIASGRVARLSLVQSDADGRGMIWPQHLVVALSSGGVLHEFDLVLNGREAIVEAAAGLPAPDWVLPAGHVLGYGLFQLDPATVHALGRSIHHIQSSSLRGAALVALWELMLEGLAPVELVRQALLSLISVENDEVLLQIETDHAVTLFWRLTRAEDRATIAPALENTLRSRLSVSGIPSQRALWFTTLRSIAATETQLAWLDEVWQRKAGSELELVEAQESELALELAVRGYGDVERRLEEQKARIEDRERRARFSFLVPAVAPDFTTRTRFVEGLRDPEMRRREPWVVDALRYVNHPLRALEARPFVRPLLELLPEIRRTGSIFFPKRWADATLSGHQSSEVAVVVRACLESLGGAHSERLRQHVLSAADPVFRAVRLLSREHVDREGSGRVRTD